MLGISGVFYRAEHIWCFSRWASLSGALNHAFKVRRARCVTNTGHVWRVFSRWIYLVCFSRWAHEGTPTPSKKRWGGAVVHPVPKTGRNHFSIIGMLLCSV